MKISDFKIVVAELNQKLLKEAKSKEAINLASGLNDLLFGLDDEEIVNDELMTQVKAILDEFWFWVAQNLPCAKWQEGIEVNPWLGLQQQLAENATEKSIKASEELQKEKLSYEEILKSLNLRLQELISKSEESPQTIQKLHEELICTIETRKQREFELGLIIKSRLLVPDYHHYILYQELAERYDSLGKGQLKLAQLMPVLIYCSRLIGYANAEELDTYPIAKLNHKISLLRRGQEAGKLKDITVLLGTIFYVIHHYCESEQLDLLPFLIHFRESTTKEERRSELAILNYLYKRAADYQLFFKKHECLIDARVFNDADCLKDLSRLVPTRRPEFIKAINERPWFYLIQQSRNQSSINESDLLSYITRLLDDDFSNQEDKSFPAALDFANKVRAQISSLATSEANLLHSGLKLLCLDKYVKLRQDDKRHYYSFLSFSGKTKCKAAEKKQRRIRGESVQMSFFDVLALNQGRLRDAIDNGEDKEGKQPDSLRF